MAFSQSRWWNALVTMALVISATPSANARDRTPVQPSWNGMAIGAYVWDGLPETGSTTEDPLMAAARLLTEKKVGAIRLTVNRQQMRGFRIEAEGCGPRPRVDCYLRDREFRAVIEDPRFRVVGLTLHELTLSGSKMTSKAQIDQNIEVARKELRDFLEALLPIMTRDPGKVFIISNWEGDNILYCGSAWSFTQKTAFREKCLGTPAAGRSPQLDERRDALITWYRARQEEIDAFRARHALGGRILHAIEFNTVQRLVDFEKRQGLDLPQTLLDIIPAVKPDLCSYSAYSSFKENYDFSADLRLIKEKCGAGAVMLGELGFNSARGRPEEIVAARYRNAFDEARRAGVRAIFVWQAFESPSAAEKYGLFRRDGTPFQWRFLGNLF